jgi:hypothetical protein
MIEVPLRVFYGYWGLGGFDPIDLNYYNNFAFNTELLYYILRPKI